MKIEKIKNGLIGALVMFLVFTGITASWAATTENYNWNHVKLYLGTLVMDGTITSKAITASGAITSSTNDMGWAVVAGANTACTTTCTFACIFGVNTASATADIVNCADATADECLCAGAS